METVVLAVGGNALLRPGDRGTAEEQMLRARETAESIYPLFKLTFDLKQKFGGGVNVTFIVN